MKILFAGKYNPEYNRTKIILEGLKQLPDVEVIEMPFAKKKEFNQKAFEKIEQEIDFIFCPAFSHKYVRFLKKRTTKPLVFDPLISNYLTKVFDYKNVSRFSPRAYKNYLKDKLPFKASDLLLADTEEHKKYYNATFGIPLEKIKVLPIGAILSDFTPTPVEKTTTFKVGFYGGFIPLQGVKNIIEAAELLKDQSDIHFHLIGTGFQYEEMQALVKKKGLINITFEGWVEYKNIAQHLNSYSICLGIFGETPKAQLVIPNKIYHYAAMGKAIITMDTPAIREIFTDQENIVLCQNTPEAIRENIAKLYSNPTKRNKLESSTLQLLKEQYNEKVIAKKLVELFISIK